MTFTVATNRSNAKSITWVRCYLPQTTDAANHQMGIDAMLFEYPAARLVSISEVA